MSYKVFVENLQEMEDEYNEKMNRVQNVNTLTPYPRKWSRYLTYVLYRMNFVKGHHVLFIHFMSDVTVLWFVYTGKPLVVLLFLFISHILDNCDGDLARARNEADMKWGEVDNYLHLLSNMAFWIILATQTNPTIIVVLLSSRVINEMFRQKKEYKDRLGERNKIWQLVVWPTNVNIMYLLYVSAALIGGLFEFVYFYASYLTAGMLWQSVTWLKGVIYGKTV